MSAETVLRTLHAIVIEPGDRSEKARRLAQLIRQSGAYRWVGLYDVDRHVGLASNIAWDGPGAPAHPTFPITQGLTSRAVAGRCTVNVGDVTQAADYLKTLATTRSEIIVPVLDRRTASVVGTLDVESERQHAFDSSAQRFLEACAEVVAPLWEPTVETIGPSNPAGAAGAHTTDRSDREKWEWSADEIRRIGHRVVDLIAEHLTTLPNRPVFRPFPQYLAARYLDRAPWPESGQSADDVLTAFQNEIEPFPLGNGHPRFYAWVNSPPAVIGVFAEALAAAMNSSCAGGNHGAIYVERQVIHWFIQLLGLPDDSMGLLVSGGSMAALTALAVARHAKCGFDVRATGVQSTPSRLVFYKSAEGHGCNQKAIELLGIGSDNLRIVEHDQAQRMRPTALDAAIQRDLEDGNRPIAVIASAGTVNTGTIDPLDEIADICQQHDVWLHVDGAYGAPAVLSKRYRHELTALARADSVALDPHKWLYVPVEAGLVLVRHGETMRAAFSLVPPYLRTDNSPSGVGGLPWFSEYGFQQTRGFRALKVWMALKFHGVEGYRRAIDKDIALAEQLAAALREEPELDVCEPQSLSIVCFRYVPWALREDADALNELNKRLLERLQLGGQVFMSSTLMNGTLWLRACIVNPRTSEADIPRVVEIVKATGREIHS